MSSVLVLLLLLLKVPGGWTGEFNNAPWEQIGNEIHKGYGESLPMIQILWSSRRNIFNWKDCFMNRIVAIGMLVLMTGVRVEGEGDRKSPVSVMRFEDDGLRLKSRPVRAEVGTNQTLFIRALIRIPGSPSSIDIEIPNATVGTFSRAKVKGFRCSYSQMASSDWATTYHAGTDFTVSITALGKVGEVIEGTFSGTVARPNGEVRELTNGTFWAIRQAPEPVAK